MVVSLNSRLESNKEEDDVVRAPACHGRELPRQHLREKLELSTPGAPLKHTVVVLPLCIWSLWLGEEAKRTKVVQKT